jgi:ribosomal protein S6--L-glutamate ligase
MREVALGCGRAFGVGLYGVDLITSGGKPYIVDINTFPGFKGVPNAAGLLAEQILNSASGIGDVDRGNRTTSND